MSKLEAMLEGERRGILPEKQQAILAEGRKRGLIPALEPQQEGPSGLEQAAQGFIDTMTFGYGDEIEAYLRSKTGIGTTADGSYEQELAEVRKRQEGGLLSPYGAGLIPSLVVPGAGAAKAIQGATTGLGKIGTGAAIGAGQGALAGSGFAEEGERVEGAVVGGALGAGVGVAAGTLGDIARPATATILNKLGFEDVPIAKAKEEITERLRSDAQKLKGKEKAAWDIIDQSSGAFETPGVALYARQNMQRKLDELADPDLASFGGKLLNRVIPDVEGMKKIGLKDLSNYRKALNRAYSPSNPEKNRVIGILKDELDDNIASLTRSALYKGDPQDALKIRKAKDLTAEYKRTYDQNRILKTLIDDDANPDLALNFLFNVNSITRNKNALSALKTIQEKSPKTGEALQIAAWQKITRNKQGDQRTAKEIQNFINEMNLNNNQLSRQLFGKDWPAIRQMATELPKSADNSIFNKLAKKFGRSAALAISGGGTGGAAWFAYDTLFN
jgi:hypothetical protein